MTIEVQNLYFSYEKPFPILEDISFSIQKGQFIGIFGPNGGGKTTLLRLLLGLAAPISGKITVLGQSPHVVSDKLGYVPQVKRFDKQFPILAKEVVLQGRLSRYRGWGKFEKLDRQKAAEAMDKVGMGSFANCPFGTLSGGQIQRILIARALASDPEILFLDEATVGIDPEGLSAIYDFLVKIKGEVTIILVTHELQAIANEMNELYCISKTLTRHLPKQVCGHFAMGLYHPPIQGEDLHR